MKWGKLPACHESRGASFQLAPLKKKCSGKLEACPTKKEVGSYFPTPPNQDKNQ